MLRPFWKKESKIYKDIVRVNNFPRKRTGITDFSIQKTKGDTFADFTVTFMDDKLIRDIAMLTDKLESEIKVSVYFEPIYGYVN